MASSIFECLTPPKKNVKELDYQLYDEKNKIYSFLPKYDFLCLEKINIKYGENTSRNKITLNCIENFKKYNIKMPKEFEVIDKYLLWGK